MFQLAASDNLTHMDMPSSWVIILATIRKRIKYIGGLFCTFGGVYLGNAYGASYWRFGPLNLA